MQDEELIERLPKAGDRVTIKGEREVYGEGTVTSVEGNCVKVRWNSDAHVCWSFADDIEVLPADRLSSTPVMSVSGEAFQARVAPWMQECFGPVISADKLERNDRFIEEALELVQSLGYSADRAHALVDYVFGRPIGEPSQEVGGAMVTLAALCLADDLNMHDAGEVELARINQPEIIAKIRAKQAAKPTGSALPTAALSTPVTEAAQEREINLLREVEEAARDYAGRFMVDEAEDTDGSVCSEDQHLAAKRLCDAIADIDANLPSNAHAK